MILLFFVKNCAVLGEPATLAFGGSGVLASGVLQTTLVTVGPTGLQRVRRGVLPNKIEFRVFKTGAHQPQKKAGPQPHFPPHTKPTLLS